VSGRSTSTSRSGPWRIRPGGRRGSRPARSAAPRSRRPRNAGTARPGWTNAPASGCLSCPCWCAPPTTGGWRPPVSWPQPQAAGPGEVIDGTDGTLRKAVAPKAIGRLVWAEDLATGKRRNLSYEDEEAFWALATIEVLRLTGIRCEELLELSHHSVTEYRLPGTGELVPLLQIAPSKTDTERLLLVSPELADVLGAIVQRLRGPDGAVPLVVAYDVREKIWHPPMPLLFQRGIGNERRAFTPSAIRKLLINALAATGLADANGDPLLFQAHDFRRIFVTDAIMNGLPPHIAQVICGHKSIETTMGYKAVYPAETIEAHRAFIARRRGTRPSEEYRTPTDEEWDSFLAHFEKRKSGRCRLGPAREHSDHPAFTSILA
jgi:integrase